MCVDVRVSSHMFNSGGMLGRKALRKCVGKLGRAACVKGGSVYSSNEFCGQSSLVQPMPTQPRRKVERSRICVSRSDGQLAGRQARGGNDVDRLGHHL